VGTETLDAREADVHRSSPQGMRPSGYYTSTNDLDRRQISVRDDPICNAPAIRHLGFVFCRAVVGIATVVNIVVALLK